MLIKIKIKIISLINYNDKDKDKLHNFSDKVLNTLTNITKLKEQILIKKGRGTKFTYKEYKAKT